MKENRKKKRKKKKKKKKEEMNRHNKNNLLYQWQEGRKKNERSVMRWSERADKKTKENNPLRKHAYSNILQILSPKNENFQIKNSDNRRGGSNEYPQSMFWSEIRKINVLYKSGV